MPQPPRAPSGVDMDKLMPLAATMGEVFWLDGLAALMRSTWPDGRMFGMWEGAPLAKEIRPWLERAVSEGVIMPGAIPDLPGEEAYAFVDPDHRARLIGELSTFEFRRAHYLTAQWLARSRPLNPTAGRLRLQAEHLEAAGNRQEAARGYHEAGLVAEANHRLSLARTLMARALSLTDDDDLLSTMDVLHDLGRVEERVGNHRQAMDLFSRMLDLAWILDHRSKGGAAYNRMGRVHRAQGRFEQAMDCFMIAWGLFESNGDVQGQASCMDDVGQIHYLRGDLDEALAQMKRALELRRAEPRSMALSLHNIGTVLLDMGEVDSALEHLARALELRKAIGRVDDVVATLTIIGEAYDAQGRTDRAMEVWAEARTLAQDLGSRTRLARVLVDIAGVRAREGDPAEAVRLLEETFSMKTVLADPVVSVRGPSLLSRLLAIQGERARAVEISVLAVERAEKFDNPRLLDQAVANRGEVARLLGDEVLAEALVGGDIDVDP